MPFYHHIHCKYTGIRGILTVYNHYLKFKYRVGEKALKKARILVFWEKYGLQSTLDAFPVKKGPLYRERFNRTPREEFMDFHKTDLLNPNIFNNKIIDYLAWYNTKRVHHAFKNKLSPIQFIQTLQVNNFNSPQKFKVGWIYIGT
jgi:transposase InsO family protein